MDRKEAIAILSAFGHLRKHGKVTVDELLAALLEVEEPKGVVYLLDYGEGTYKIGKTINLDRRMKELRKLGDFELVCYIPCNDDGSTIEAGLHNHFADSRIYSELYNLCDEDVRAIKRLASKRLYPSK